MSTHIPIAQPRWVALAALTLVAVGSLSGCGLAFADPDATETTPTSSSPQTPQADPAADPSGIPESPDASEPTESEEVGVPSADRDALIAQAQQTIPCSAGLDIANDGVVIRVEGACDAITVSADAAIVIVDDVTTLTVSGSGSVVDALELADLRISGDVNEVRWTGATPAVTDEGTANTIGQVQ